LEITGAAAGTPVEVYDASGRLAARCDVGGPMPLLPSAIYIIKVGSTVVKVRL
jgi:hypothetical protein